MDASWRNNNVCTKATLPLSCWARPASANLRLSLLHIMRFEQIHRDPLLHWAMRVVRETDVSHRTKHIKTEVLVHACKGQRYQNRWRSPWAIVTIQPCDTLGEFLDGQRIDGIIDKQLLLVTAQACERVLRNIHIHQSLFQINIL